MVFSTPPWDASHHALQNALHSLPGACQCNTRGMRAPQDAAILHTWYMTACCVIASSWRADDCGIIGLQGTSCAGVIVTHVPCACGVQQFAWPRLLLPTPNGVQKGAAHSVPTCPTPYPAKTCPLHVTPHLHTIAGTQIYVFSNLQRFFPQAFYVFKAIQDGFFLSQFTTEEKSFSVMCV